MRERKNHTSFRRKRLTRKQRRRQLRFLLALFMLALAGALASIWHDYNERPGLLERSTLKAAERGADYLTLEWKGTRNTDTYTVSYKAEGAAAGGWQEVTVRNEKGSRDSVTIEGLDEGTRYGVTVRADNSERRGFDTRVKYFATKSTQTITGGKEHYMKLTCSEAFGLGLEAATPLTYTSSDEDVVSVDKATGVITPKGRGTATVTVTAEETDDYLGDSFETEIEVISTSAVSAGGAQAHIIYNVGPFNCEKIKSVEGSGGASVPQAFGISDDKYYIAYGMSDTQRIITFDRDGDGKSVSVPEIALGHPNGFCYAGSNGTCYCVRGWSGRAVTYKPETGAYSTVTFPYGTSGIGYDRAEDRIYTCSRTLMVSYSIGESGYSVENKCGVVKHSGQTYTQDCGGHAGIMMRCLSGSSKHGTNYVDLYDMKHGLYLGTIACDLSEVESAVCDEDGYMLLLSNTSGSTDYIWKTPVNIGDIGAGIGE